MRLSLKQKAAGAVAALALGLAAVGEAPAFAAMGGGGIHVGGGGGGSHGGGAGAFHGGGSGFNGGFHSGAGAFNGGGFHGDMMGGQRFAGGGRFHGGGAFDHDGRHFARFGGFFGYGYGPYYDCGSPYALYNPSLCQYPYGY